MTDEKVVKSNTFKTPLISPEEIVLKQVYAITINPCDKRQYFDCTDRIIKLTEYMEQQLLEVPNIDFKLWMECSRNGRLHFHGTICFPTYDSIKHYYVIQLHKWLELMNIEIKIINDIEVWQTYCTKSKSLFDVFISTEKCFKKYRKVKVDKNGVAHKPYF